MVSSKKKRGKQRKAAAKSATTNNNTSSTTHAHSANDNELCVEEIAALAIVECVKKGRHDVTAALVTTAGVTCSLYSDNLPTVLKFLKRCESETFAAVMADVRVNVLPSGMGGDLKSPSVWIKFLMNACQFPSCILQIVENIGPLMKCMCADTTRQFFKRKKLWAEAILSFVQLIYNIIVGSSSTEKEKIIGTLLQYDGLLSSIVQWGFWGDEYRPDIAKALKSNDCTELVLFGRKITILLIKHATNSNYWAQDGTTQSFRSLTAEGLRTLERIGSIPIVSKDYDPTCKISCVAGMIQPMKTAKDYTYHPALQNFIVNADCIDKGVIMEVIDFGMNYANDESSVVVVMGLASAMVLQGRNTRRGLPNDTRSAFAIRAGLFEMCLGLIERYGSLDFMDALFPCLCDILKAVHKVSLHKKTAKAIRSKKLIIEEKLTCLEKKSKVANNADWKRPLVIIRSTLDINGSYCCRCNKSLGRKERMQCHGCNRMTYCSSTCQKEDWLIGGHELECSKQYTDDEAGLLQGMSQLEIMPESERAAAKLEQLDINIKMIQLKLFLDNSERIVSHARSLNLPFYDCVVHFDLCECPYTVEVMKYTEHFGTDCVKDFENSRSKDNITCTYYSYVYNGDVREDVLSDKFPGIIAMQRYFPHRWLTEFRP